MMPAEFVARLNKIRADAENAFEVTTCNGVGCCGDIGGALDYVQNETLELVTEVFKVDIHFDR